MAKEVSRAFVAYTDITVADDFNGRKSFNDIEELAVSIDKNGLINPLTVREGGPARTDGKRKVMLVAGERRYRAIGLLRTPGWAGKDHKGEALPRKTSPASWTQVEVKFVKGNTEEISLLNLIENLQRDNLDPLEEAQTMRDYLDRYEYTQASLAATLGKSEPYISQRLSLLKKTAPEVREAIAAGTITAAHARELTTLPKEEQTKILHDVQAQQKAGKKVLISDVKETADAAKNALGIKHTKEPRKERDTGVSYDEDKVKLAKEIFEGQPTTLRSKTAVLELMGTLTQRMQRANLSDATRAATKAQLVVVEWLLGARETLP